MLHAGRVFERVSNIVVLFLCSSLGICLGHSQRQYIGQAGYCWILVQSSPIISMFQWYGLKVQTRQHGAAWSGRVEHKEAECTWSHEQTLLLRGAGKEVAMWPRGNPLLRPRTQYGRNSTEGFVSQNLWHGGPVRWKSYELHQCSGCYKYRLHTQKHF